MRDNRIRLGEPTYYSGIDDLSTLSDTEKVEWFRRRLDKTVIRPLWAVRRMGNESQDIWDLNLGVITIICCAIQALGSFYRPRLRDRAAFDRFVCDFMNPEWNRVPTGHQRRCSQILWDHFRSGLAHGFTIVGHEIATRPDDYIADANGVLSVDLWTLFEDLEAGVGRYLDAVYSEAAVKGMFLHRFDEVFVQPYRKKA